MCQKGQIFRQFYAVMIVSPTVKPTALQVFKTIPSELQVSSVINKYVIGKVPPVAHAYGDKPQVHVVPVKIATDIMW
jgi:hypothetical protein